MIELPFQFLTLFEPTIAICFGFKKKITSAIDLTEIFKPMAVIPATKVSEDHEFIDLGNLPNIDVEDTLAEVSDYLLFYIC